jgi:hypothetical protein
MAALELRMPRLSDEELTAALESRRSEALCVPHEPYPKAKPNDCHENARLYADEHPGCSLIRGWLIEQFVGWNYFVAHTLIELLDGSWIDPTPMCGQYPFVRHPGNDEDFEEQRRNRAQVQFVPGDVNDEELQTLLSDFDLPVAEVWGTADEDMI